LIFIQWSEKYNVWSFILHKFTCGKYKYIEVDYKGFISPEEKGVEEENLIKGDKEANMINEDKEANNMIKGDIINDVSDSNE